MVENKPDAKMLAEKAYSLGFEYEKKYGGCSQCTLAALQDLFDMRNDDVFRASTALVGGVGGFCDAGCGAYSAGVLFFSGLHGRERNDFDMDEPIGKENKAMGLSMKLHDRFIEEYGTVICRDIHMKLFGRTYNLHDDAEWDQFEADGGHTDVCPGVVGKTARWVVELLDEEGLLPEG
jgi:hypothetical protein